MNIARLGCRTARDGIVVSAIFLAMALALIWIARSLPVGIAYVPEILTGLGLILLLMAPLILIASVLRGGR